MSMPNSGRCVQVRILAASSVSRLTNLVADAMRQIDATTQVAQRQQDGDHGKDRIMIDCGVRIQQGQRQRQKDQEPRDRRDECVDIDPESLHFSPFNPPFGGTRTQG